MLLLAGSRGKCAIMCKPVRQQDCSSSHTEEAIAYQERALMPKVKAVSDILMVDYKCQLIGQSLHHSQAL